jgi:hypothetical protein
MKGEYFLVAIIFANISLYLEYIGIHFVFQVLRSCLLSQKIQLDPATSESDNSLPGFS